MISLPDQIKEEAIKKMVDVSSKILKDEINFVKGCREIHRLSSYIDNPDDVIFNVFTLVVSDTDYIPVDEKVRKNCDSDYLKKSDREMEEYFNDMKLTIRKACKKVLKKYSNLER